MRSYSSLRNSDVNKNEQKQEFPIIITPMSKFKAVKQTSPMLNKNKNIKTSLNFDKLSHEKDYKNTEDYTFAQSPIIQVDVIDDSIETERKGMRKSQKQFNIEPTEKNKNELLKANINEVRILNNGKSLLDIIASSSVIKPSANKS